MEVTVEPLEEILPLYSTQVPNMQLQYFIFICPALPSVAAFWPTFPAFAATEKETNSENI